MVPVTCVVSRNRCISFIESLVTSLEDPLEVPLDHINHRLTLDVRLFFFSVNSRLVVPQRSPAQGDLPMGHPKLYADQND